MVPAKTYKEICFEVLDSTNAYALQKVHELDDCTVIVARTQTKGAGRLSREWFSSNPENIYLSIVLKPQAPVRGLPLASLTQYMSVVLCGLLGRYSVSAEIKWPNDTLVNGKKIAGVLSQSSIIGERLEGFVLGIGINLNLEMDELSLISQPATSLNLLTGRKIDVSLFRKELLDSFFEGYDHFLANGFSVVRDEYLRRSSFLGRAVKVEINGKINAGTASDITTEGALVFSNDHGSFKITTGELI